MSSETKFFRYLLWSGFDANNNKSMLNLKHKECCLFFNIEMSIQHFFLIHLKLIRIYLYFRVWNVFFYIVIQECLLPFGNEDLKLYSPQRNTYISMGILEARKLTRLVGEAIWKKVYGATTSSLVSVFQQADTFQ